MYPLMKPSEVCTQVVAGPALSLDPDAANEDWISVPIHGITHITRLNTESMYIAALELSNNQNPRGSLRGRWRDKRKKMGRGLAHGNK